MAGFENTGMTIDGIKQPKGYTERFDHYESWCYFWTKQIYEITSNENHPLMFVDEEKNQWRCDKHYWSDFGSIPPPFQGVPGLDRERHKFPYMFHDNAYQEMGLWKRLKGEEKWNFTPLTRMECDLFLCRMIEYDIVPGGVVNRQMILWGVRLGGSRYFGRGDWRKSNTKPPEQPRFPIALA